MSAALPRIPILPVWPSLAWPMSLASPSRFFSMLGKENINVDIILQSIGRDQTKDISFTVGHGDMERVRELLEERKSALRYDHVDIVDTVAKISIVGAGMVNNAGVASQMFEALYSAGVNINMISTSEIKISVLVNKNEADRAVQAIHDRFFSQFGSHN